MDFGFESNVIDRSEEERLWSWLDMEMIICKCYHEMNIWHNSEVCLNSCPISKTELFAKIVKDWKPLAIFAKRFVLGVWLGSEYVSVIKLLLISAIPYRFSRYDVILFLALRPLFDQKPSQIIK